MCQSDEQNTLQHEKEVDRDEEVWWQNVIYSDFPHFLSPFLLGKGEVIRSKSEPFMANWKDILRLFTSKRSRTLPKSFVRQQSSSSPKKQDNTKFVQIPTETSCCCRERLDVLHTELLHTKIQIENYKSLYTNYIEALSLYILYTNIIILLLYLIIIIIIVLYPPNLYSYFYYINVLYMCQ